MPDLLIHYLMAYKLWFRQADERFDERLDEYICWYLIHGEFRCHGQLKTAGFTFILIISIPKEASVTHKSISTLYLQNTSITKF